jgi:protein SCO1
MMRKMFRPHDSPRCSFRSTRFITLCFAAAAVLTLAGCSASRKSAQRYQLHGKIVAVNVNEGFADVDADAIPGYMAAMTMPYPIPDPHVLSTLAIGDEITADLIVTDQGPHLENVVIVKKSGAPPPSPSSQFHMPKPGEAVPDFVVSDQHGKHLHLSSFRGHFVFITFVYTRCPFANYCPRISHNFAEIYAAVAKQPELASNVRLLSVSFDPVHDTAAVLRSYAASFHDVTGTTQPFALWDFASVPKKELPAIAHFFGLYVSDTNGQIVHSLSTTLISPEGKVVSWFHGNEWEPRELVADATSAIASEQHADAARSDRSNRRRLSGS